MQEGPLFATPYPAFIFFRLFNDDHSDWYELISHCSFNLHTKLLQSCLTLCNPLDCNLQGSSVHGILQARILEWLPWPSPVDLPDPGIKPKSLALHENSSSFDLNFSNNEQYWKSLYVSINHLFCFIWRNVCLGFLPTFWVGVCCSCIKLYELLICFGN